MTTTIFNFIFKLDIYFKEGYKMKIVQLKDEINAISYVYNKAIPKKIPFDIFNNLVLNENNNLPKFYVLIDNNEYIGYLLLLADKKEDIPKPFTFLACHNADELDDKNHKELLEFIIKNGKENGWQKLVFLAENDLKNLK